MRPKGEAKSCDTGLRIITQCLFRAGWWHGDREHHLRGGTDENHNLQGPGSCTSQCGFHPVMSQQEDNAPKRNGEEGVAHVGNKTQTHHPAVFLGPSITRYSFSGCHVTFFTTLPNKNHTENYLHVGIRHLMVSNYVFCLFCKYLSGNS